MTSRCRCSLALWMIAVLFCTISTVLLSIVNITDTMILTDKGCHDYCAVHLKLGLVQQCLSLMSTWCSNLPYSNFSTNKYTEVQFKIMEDI